MTNTTSGPFPAWLAAIPVGAAALLVGLVIFRLKNFDLTYQAWDLWKAGDTPATAFLAGHPHAMRYVIYYPMFLIADTLSISVEMVFGLVCTALYALLIAAMAQIELTVGRSGYWRVPAYSILFLVLVLLMNGRLLIAFAGYAVVIWAFVSGLAAGWRIRNGAALLAGAVLTSISSGTLFVAATYAILCSVYIFGFARPRVQGAPALGASLAIAALLFASTLWIGFFKNVDYFGGGLTGLVGMLDHGLGRAFLKFGAAGVVSAAFLAIAGLAVAFSLGRWLAPLLVLILFAILPAAVGGLFGISTMAVGLIPLLLLLRGEALAVFRIHRKATA